MLDMLKEQKGGGQRTAEGETGRRGGGREEQRPASLTAVPSLLSRESFLTAAEKSLLQLSGYVHS